MFLKIGCSFCTILYNLSELDLCFELFMPILHSLLNLLAILDSPHVILIDHFYDCIIKEYLRLVFAKEMIAFKLFTCCTFVNYKFWSTKLFILFSGKTILG